MSARLRALVARHAGWRRESGTQDAGCLTVVTGRSRAATARAFGVDLSAAAPAPSGTPQAWGPDPTASLVATAHATATGGRVCTVLEAHGGEGSREVVLVPASQVGKAASVCWDTRGTVLFSCARQGKVVWQGELGTGADLQGLPRRLVALADLAEPEGAEGADETDAVAVGAAMVEAFTGVEVRPGHLAGAPRHTVTPRIEQPPAVNPESSGLKWSHPDLVAALDAVPASRRRPLTHLALRALVHHAGLAHDDVVATALERIGTDAPGVLPPALDGWERRRSREGDRLGGLVSEALRYACHPDHRSALLGVADDLVTVHGMAGQEVAAASALLAAARTDPEGWDRAFAQLRRETDEPDGGPEG